MRWTPTIRDSAERVLSVRRDIYLSVDASLTDKKSYQASLFVKSRPGTKCLGYGKLR